MVDNVAQFRLAHCTNPIAMLFLKAMETSVIEIVTQVDDITGEQLSHIADQLIAEGACDAWWQPIIMKQARPATQIHMLCAPDKQIPLSQRLMQLTGSFGCRFQPWQRTTLERQWVDVTTPYGTIRFKQGFLKGQLISQKPEWQDCATAAAQHSITPRQVYLEALRHAPKNTFFRN